jgi:tripartite-type tricarboxylate transporter receptor subunit TctC
MQSPEAREQLARQGAAAHSESSAEFTAFMKAERERIARIGREAL